MERVIGGKSYDTDTADFVCDVTPPGASPDRSDFHWEDTGLYRTGKGQFFVAGEGGALTRWRRPVEGGNASTGGEGLVLVDEAEARRLVEEHGTPALYRELFGEPEEG